MVSIETNSHALVSTLVIEQRRTRRPEIDRLDRTEKDVVAADRTHLDDAAIEGDHRCREHRTAGRERRPFAAREAVGPGDTGAAGKQVGDGGLAGAERVDAEHAVLG